MGVIPDSKQAVLNWGAAHAPVWETNAVAIGLTVAEASAFTDKVDAAQTAWDSAIAARDAAKAATTTSDAAFDSLFDKASITVSTIKAFADKQANPAAVYALAQIPMPATPQPSGPPPAPTNVTCAIDNLGRVDVRWSGSTQYSTFFTVWRKLFGQQTWTQVGATGSKSLVDDTVPAGTVSATYYVQAQRGAVAGPPSETIAVIFGAGQQEAA